jgi:hypothetical protein
MLNSGYSSRVPVFSPFFPPIVSDLLLTGPYNVAALPRCQIAGYSRFDVYRWFHLHSTYRKRPPTATRGKFGGRRLLRRDLLVYVIRPPQYVPMTSRISRLSHMLDVHWQE